MVVESLAQQLFGPVTKHPGYGVVDVAYGRVGPNEHHDVGRVLDQTTKPLGTLVYFESFS